VEAAHSIAKNKLLNESGNILVVISIIGMIAGLIGYWTSLTDKTDKEIRSLGATQSLSFLRADFQNTIKKSLLGTNSACPATGAFGKQFLDKFRNYSLSSTEAIISRIFIDNLSTSENEITTTSSPTDIFCYVNISRYAGVDFNKIQIKISRATEPNYVTLSNFISADITVNYKSNDKPGILKYQLKYRVDVLTLNSFGLIFTNTLLTNSPRIAIPPNTFVKVKAPTLFDNVSDRTKEVFLNNFMHFPGTDKLIYSDDVFSTAPGFKVDASNGLNFLKTKHLYDVFKQGIHYNQLPKGSFQAPYQISTTSQWSEILDYKPLESGYYPLPNTSGKVSAIFDNVTNSVVQKFDTANINNLNDTKKIYEHILGTSKGKYLTHSCRAADNLDSLIYPLYIFNNLNSDFIIDFTENKEADYPPVFCGLIAAKKLIIKLNNEQSNSTFFQHHIIGKFIISDSIQIINQGSLNIHDLMTFTEDLIQYSGTQISINNLRTQFYNYKYYSAQNFSLPFFKEGKTPNITDNNSLASTAPNRFYVPRASKAFFNRSCGPNNFCRVDEILSPALDDLTKNHWNNLIFEVYNAD
jgi:hypothetical protein